MEQRGRRRRTKWSPAGRRRPWPAAAGGGARWPRLREGKREREEAHPGQELTPERMPWTVMAGEAGVDGDGARTAAGRAGETGSIRPTGGVPACTSRRGGVGEVGGAGGGVGLLWGGRSRRRARQQWRRAGAHFRARVRVPGEGARERGESVAAAPLIGPEEGGPQRGGAGGNDTATAGAWRQ